jgi:hypothetical protein
MDQINLKGEVNKTGTDWSPTVAEYSGLQAAFEHLNKELFNGELPNVMIVETRRAHSYGHLAPNRFTAREGDARFHELSLNPDMFFGHPDKEILSTLLHEAVHVLQEVRGTAPRGNYHNKDWGAQMKIRGLYPSNTGAPGGKETGGANVPLHHPRRRLRAVVRTIRGEGLEAGLAVGDRRRSARRQEEQDEIHLPASVRRSRLGQAECVPGLRCLLGREPPGPRRHR